MPTAHPSAGLPQQHRPTAPGPGSARNRLHSLSEQAQLALPRIHSVAAGLLSAGLTAKNSVTEGWTPKDGSAFRSRKTVLQARAPTNLCLDTSSFLQRRRGNVGLSIREYGPFGGCPIPLRRMRCRRVSRRRTPVRTSVRGDIERQFQPRPNSQLVEGCPQIVLHDLLAGMELGGNILVCQTLPYQGRYLNLICG